MARVMVGSVIAGSAIVLGVVLGAASASADGGWSGDPAVNMVVADRAGEQVQPKLAPTSDGGFYLSWYDDAAGGYDVALQRYDAAGVEQWAHNGIIVADTGFSWVTDYDLTVDDDNEALVGFRDDRGGAEHVTIARIAPDGTMLWGEDGIIVDAGPAEFLGPPGIVSTADDQVVVAWTHDAEIRVRRLDLAGRAIWSSDVKFIDPTDATQMLADVQPTPDGGVIVSWVHTASFVDPRHLWAQRLSRDGQALWGTEDPATGVRQPLVVFGDGTLQYGNFPPFVADPSGGAVFAWYETDPVLQVRVQHVRADGTTVFPAGGALTTDPDPTVQRVEPAMAYDPATDDIYVMWRNTYDSGPLDQWIYAQRFGADGRRAWGPMGTEIEPHGAHEVSQLEAEAFGGGVLFAYVEKLDQGNERVWIRRLDASGDSVWAQERVAVSSVASAKSRLELAVTSLGMPVLAWQDTRAGSEDIYAQNVNADGSLGPSGTPGPTRTPEASGTPPTATSVPTMPPPPTAGPTDTATVPPPAGRIFLPFAVRGGAVAAPPPSATLPPSGEP